MAMSAEHRGQNVQLHRQWLTSGTKNSKQCPSDGSLSGVMDNNPHWVVGPPGLTSMNQTLSLLLNNRRRYMAEILPIRCKILFNQSTIAGLWTKDVPLKSYYSLMLDSSDSNPRFYIVTYVTIKKRVLESEDSRINYSITWKLQNLVQRMPLEKRYFRVIFRPYDQGSRSLKKFQFLCPRDQRSGGILCLSFPSFHYCVILSSFLKL